MPVKLQFMDHPSFALSMDCAKSRGPGPGVPNHEDHRYWVKQARTLVILEGLKTL